MANASGVDAQFGFAEETTYGTFVSPTRFLEFLDESMVPDVVQVLSRGLGRARTQRATQVRTYVRSGGGPVKFHVMTSGFGLLFKHMLGAVSSSGSGDPYTHTITPHASGLSGIKGSVQIGKPDTGGTVNPFNFPGCKVAKWKLSSKVGEPLELEVTFDSKTFETSTALASKSYSADAIPLIFADGSASINSSSVFIKAFTLEGDNGLDLEREGIGNVKKEPLPKDELAITGSLDFEFDGVTRQTALTAGTLIDDLSLAFTLDTHSLTIDVPQFIYLPDGSPKVGGPGVVQQSMPWKALDNGSDALITFTYVTPDSTP